MKHILILLLLTGFPSLTLCTAQPWRTPLTEWTDADAHRVLMDSPWVKHINIKVVGTHPESGGVIGFNSISRINLVVRWESAQTIRQAMRRVGITAAVGDSADYYAIAVLGLPKATNLKPNAQLQHDHKTLEPSSVKILEQDDGVPLVVFLFPRIEDIPEPGVFRLPVGPAFKSKNFTFDARIGGVWIQEKFSPRDMLYLGKLDL